MILKDVRVYIFILITANIVCKQCQYSITTARPLIVFNLHYVTLHIDKEISYLKNYIKMENGCYIDFKSEYLPIRPLDTRNHKCSEQVVRISNHIHPISLIKLNTKVNVHVYIYASQLSVISIIQHGYFFYYINWNNNRKLSVSDQPIAKCYMGNYDKCPSLLHNRKIDKDLLLKLNYGWNSLKTWHYKIYIISYTITIKNRATNILHHAPFIPWYTNVPQRCKVNSTNIQINLMYISSILINMNFTYGISSSISQLKQCLASKHTYNSMKLRIYYKKNSRMATIKYTADASEKMRFYALFIHRELIKDCIEYTCIYFNMNHTNIKANSMCNIINTSYISNKPISTKNLTNTSYTSRKSISISNTMTINHINILENQYQVNCPISSYPINKINHSVSISKLYIVFNKFNSTMDIIKCLNGTYRYTYKSIGNKMYAYSLIKQYRNTIKHSILCLQRIKHANICYSTSKYSFLKLIICSFFFLITTLAIIALLVNYLIVKNTKYNEKILIGNILNSIDTDACLVNVHLENSKLKKTLRKNRFRYKDNQSLNQHIFVSDKLCPKIKRSTPNNVNKPAYISSKHNKRTKSLKLCQDSGEIELDLELL